MSRARIWGMCGRMVVYAGDAGDAAMRRCGLGRRSEQESQKGRDELEASRHGRDDDARR